MRLFKSKLRKSIETMRSERLYERAELSKTAHRTSSWKRTLELYKEIKLLDEILNK